MGRAVFCAKTEYKLVQEIKKLNEELQLISDLLSMIFSFTWQYLAILNAPSRIEVFIVAQNITY